MISVSIAPLGLVQQVALEFGLHGLGHRRGPFDLTVSKRRDARVPGGPRR